MSNKFRNPFRMRASERIESDADFLRLFSPEVLDLILEEKGEKLWNNVVFIRSSPGAGKTSLLRIFEPNSLTTVFNQRSQHEFKELFSPLKRIGVISEKGVNTLGVLIRCTKNYELLEDIRYEEALKIRLLYSLLNARIIIATLRSLLTLRKLKFPEDLNRIEFSYEDEALLLHNIKTPCNGRQLFEWGKDIEQKVYQLLDSFMPSDIGSIEGHDELFSLSILKPKYFTIDGKPVFQKALFMIDDAHKLSIEQRKSLFSYLTEERGTYSLWIAERLEGLTNLESYLERDYDEINLEKYWSNNTRKFRILLSKIALKRAAISTDDLTSFSEYLNDEINEVEFHDVLESSISDSIQNIKRLTAHTSRFNEWTNFLNNIKDITLENALKHKAIEILINREIRNSQLTLNFPMTIKELTEKIDPQIEYAAKLFLYFHYGLPEYYGFNKLVAISSNNIDQFISFAADLFEGMLSKKISGKEVILSAREQEKIITNLVSKKWKELKVLIPNSELVTRFIDKLGNYCKEITYKSTASYAPGITGFAFKSIDELTLFYKHEKNNNELHETIHSVLSICLAYNLLELRDVTQGKQGQIWKVYYLNRWLCIRYKLPLAYGGWNKISIKTVHQWILP